jgi:CHAD domain-containing protein
MTLDEALRAHLVADVAVAALVGSRIYPVSLAQQGSLPAIMYRRVAVWPEHDRSSRRADIARTRYQVECYGATFDDARAVATALKDALATLTKASDPAISHALVQSEFDDFEPEPGRWRAIVDVHIYHEE